MTSSFGKGKSPGLDRKVPHKVCVTEIYGMTAIYETDVIMMETIS